MASKNRLMRDPNVSDADNSILRRMGAGLSRTLTDTGAGLSRALDSIGRSQQYTAKGTEHAYDNLRLPIERGAADFAAGFNGTEPDYSQVNDAPPDYTSGRPSGRVAAPVQAAPPPARPDPLSTDQRTAASEYGAKVGRAAQGYLGARESLAPGVRRLGMATADPAAVYVTVDKNGNRVYTDNPKFAAGMSTGRALRRSDLAPGMSESEITDTLDNPEGGFAYAPASKQALAGLEAASAATRGGSKTIESALAEAQRAQAIADTLAGDRPIDKQRANQSSTLRRNLGLETGGGNNLSLRDILALQANDRAERQFAHTVEQDKTTNNRSAATEQRQSVAQQVGDILNIRKGIKDGTIDPNDGYAIIASMVQDINSPAGRATQSEANRRLADVTAKNNRGLGWFRNFGFDSGEAKDVTLEQLHLNPDGSGAVAEPDIGMFDQGDTTAIAGQDLRRALGPDEIANLLMQYTQRQRVGRGE